MGLPLKKLANQVTKLAFNLASDLTFSATYQHPTASNYDPETGEPDYTCATKTVKAMLLQFSEKEVDGTVVKIGDERIFIQLADLPDITPGTDDVIIDPATSIERQVISFTLDPTKVFYNFHVRREVVS